MGPLQRPCTPCLTHTHTAHATPPSPLPDTKHNLQWPAPAKTSTASPALPNLKSQRKNGGIWLIGHKTSPVYGVVEGGLDVTPLPGAGAPAQYAAT